MYNLNYTPATLGYKVEEKIYLGALEKKRLNTTALDYSIGKFHLRFSVVPEDTNPITIQYSPKFGYFHGLPNKFEQIYFLMFLTDKQANNIMH
jgi:hypothetical protein